MWEEYVMDITLGDNPPCFVPYDRETDEVILGLNMIQPTCPGKLIGVIHMGGQEEANKWVSKNPDWIKRFSSKTNDNEQ